MRKLIMNFSKTLQCKPLNVVLNSSYLKGYQFVNTPKKLFNENSGKTLLNQKKKENFKFNFKEFLENYQIHEMNIKNRKLDVDPSKIKELFNLYLKKSDNLNILRRNLNDLQNK